MELDNSSNAFDPKSYVSQHRVMHRVHAALNAAVQARAPNPLLHMARTLRRESRQAGGTVCTARPELRGAGGATLLPIGDIPSEAALVALLKGSGIDLSEWGIGETRSPAQLLAELHAGDSTLCRSAAEGGGLRRVVRHMEVELHHRGRTLVLTHDEVDGAAQQRFALPRIKARAAESWQAAARRALSELAGVEPECVTLQPQSYTSEASSAPSVAYPGLHCE
jgi:hypothetical protein